MVTVGSMLTSVKIRAPSLDAADAVRGGLCVSAAAAGGAGGRCGSRGDRSEECREWVDSWRVADPKRTIFSGYFDLADANSTSSSSVADFVRESEHFCSVNSDGDGSGGGGGGAAASDISASDLGCLDGEPFLLRALELGLSRDYAAHTDLVTEPRSSSPSSSSSSSDSLEDDGGNGGEGEDEDEVGEIAQIILSDRGPQRPPPVDGWTMASADRYCGGLIRGSGAADACDRVDSVDVASGESREEGVSNLVQLASRFYQKKKHLILVCTKDWILIHTRAKKRFIPVFFAANLLILMFI